MENKEKEKSGIENKEKEEDGIELDKLKLDNKKGPSNIAPGPVKQRPKLRRFKAPDLKGSKFANLIARNIRVLAIALLIVLLVSLSILWYVRSAPNNVAPTDLPVGQIIYMVSSAVGSQHYAMFKLYIPFEDEQERSNLMAKLPKIKDELALSELNLTKPLEQKDFMEIKRHILKTVNDITGIPVTELDLEDLTVY